jgi:hypothetical protein
MQFPHPAGWQHLSVVTLPLNDSLEARRACYLAYVAPSRTLLLLDDGGNEPGPDGSVELGKPGVIKNGQCAARLISAAGDGDTLTLAVNVTFTAGFAGKKNLFMASRDAQNNTGWQAMGSWEVRAAPAVRRPPAKTAPKKKGKG